MHILVVNDDGPPSVHSSPYVHSLVRELQRAGHQVSVCLPHAQRSWIGKAHMIGQTVKPLYYRPPPPDAPPAGLDRRDDEPDNEGSTHARPYRPRSKDGKLLEAAPEEWVLVDGTPASCAQIGLYHVFKDRGPIDLVLSGPNYGRNTTAVFALSSGTLGGALEAAACRYKAVALSYAFFSRVHDRDVIAEATRHAVRVTEALVRQWPTDGSVDLYSVNVPLVAGVSTHKTYWTELLQNYWLSGPCFVEVEATGGDAADDDEEEERIREGAEGEAAGGSSTKESTDSASEHQHKALAHKHFKWQPRFTDVYKSVEEAPPGNDGWAVKEGFTRDAAPLPTLRNLSLSEYPDIYALVAYEDPYVQPILLNALRSLVPEERLHLLTAPPGATLPTADEPVSLSSLLGRYDPSRVARGKILQITPYEVIDFAYAADHPAATLVNSYMIRKALIRKHFLAGTVDLWAAKRGDASILRQHVQRTEAFEVDYAEFLDDALVEAFDLRASMDQNDAVDAPQDRAWWILKPSMSDRGQGIRLFSTMDELQGIFDGWEEDFDEEEDEDEDGDGDGDDGNDDKSAAPPKDYIAASHLRHFVAQPYIHPPLLLPGTDGRKFHVRTYVLCVGALQVYVYRDMLALFAAKPYTPPWGHVRGGEDGEDGEDGVDLGAHLTNTCLQDEDDKGDSVRRFWDLGGGASEDTKTEEEAESRTPAAAGGQDKDAGSGSSSSVCDTLDSVFDQICRVTGELFEAAAVGTPIHFQPLAHGFEVYGLDFLVDGGGNAWLLEVNAFPDFRQTGTALQDLVAQFWAEALRLVVRRLTEETVEGGQGETREDHGGTSKMVLVKDLDLGRR